jgi:hypothetical protein
MNECKGQIANEGWKGCNEVKFLDICDWQRDALKPHRKPRIKSNRVSLSRDHNMWRILKESVEV